MISMVLPLSAGNALRLFVEPPAGAVRWKVLRRAADTFVGPDDAEAHTAYEGDDRVFVDVDFLVNGQMAFYRPYYLDIDGNWTPGPTATGTPAASYEDGSIDVQTLVRERLEAGLKVECDRGTFTTDLGYIQCFSGSPPEDNGIRFPLVVVLVQSESSGGRGIAEDLVGDTFDPLAFNWGDNQGWISDARLEICGMSRNGDERNELRRAIRRIIQANLEVFNAAGMVNIDLQQSDVDALNGEYGAPMWLSVNSFSCQAPSIVGSRTPAVRDVFVRNTNG